MCYRTDLLEQVSRECSDEIDDFPIPSYVQAEQILTRWDHQIAQWHADGKSPPDDLEYEFAKAMAKLYIKCKRTYPEMFV